MPTDPPDDRAPFAKAYDVASRVIAAGASVGVLAAGGYWIDYQLGWSAPGFLITGALLGSAAFGFQMWKLVGDLNRDQAGFQRRGDR